MVEKKKAFIVSGLSALAVGVVHYLAQKTVSMVITNTEIQTLVVVGVVVLTVFGIGYIGMTKK